MPKLRGCRKCKVLTTANTCPVCGSKDLTVNWEGAIIVVDPTRSELAKRLGITRSGIYALRIL